MVFLSRGFSHVELGASRVSWTAWHGGHTLKECCGALCKHNEHNISTAILPGHCDIEQQQKKILHCGWLSECIELC